ncbi:hypothetical protein SAMN05880590_102615 [Rhizobium sp. RU35A]|uniref:CopG family transcriptional regulator n=1 Tax=Rhizobium straminoryzae TaxID=1387186 RepID=A0A549TDL5_9HYPH|nr:MULTISPECIES: CopG family transcriptional regulator [Rhizobium]TRL40106.1 CopG family transcriptional regulator [Rhizobium straminoryzae]SIQ21439.1 hypothetical protein SAMN05880590_102615 [Rhizobium sp. RU35A]
MSKISADEFDRKFDDGDDIDDYLDGATAKTGDIGRDLFLVKLSETAAVEMAAEAGRLGLGIDRLIERWVEERLAQHRKDAAE